MTTPLPGSDEWWTYLTGSKIAAVVGTDPWTSRFTLWHRMAGTADRGETNADMERGHFLEAGVVAWWAAQNPDWTVTPGQWFTMRSRYGATPDALAVHTGTGERAIVQAKTTRYSEGFDLYADTGRDAVHPAYYDQVQWELMVTGADVAYLAVLFGLPFEFRSYRLERDDQHIQFLDESAERFLASLDANQPPSVLTGSSDTYQTVREIHPHINPDEEWEIPDELALAFLDARHDRERYEAAEQAAKNQIFHDMGDAKRAVWCPPGETRPRTIFTRSARQGGKPYATVGRSLPTTREDAA